MNDIIESLADLRFQSSPAYKGGRFDLQDRLEIMEPGVSILARL